MHAKGVFKIKSWDEGAYADLDGAPKLSRATIASDYTGDIEGEGTSGALMLYAGEESATYTGFERVAGRLAGRSGSFVLQGSGTYENGTAAVRWSVVPGSATGELEGLTGTGGYVAAGGVMEVPYELDYELDR